MFLGKRLDIGDEGDYNKKEGSSDNTLTSADGDNIVNFAEGGTLESLYPEK